MSKIRSLDSYIKILIRNNSSIGLDIDYLDKLNEKEKRFILRFILEHYCGKSKDRKIKLRANRMRYHLKVTDAMADSIYYEDKLNYWNKKLK